MAPTSGSHGSPSSLAGENSCEWATWFRARHESGSWEQVPGDFDRAGWQMAHTAMVNDSREHWEALGYAGSWRDDLAFPSPLDDAAPILRLLHSCWGSG